MSGKDGSAVFQEVIPGDYDLFALEGAKQDVWFYPQFMEKLGLRGRPIHLEKAETIREVVPVINTENGLN